MAEKKTKTVKKTNNIPKKNPKSNDIPEICSSSRLAKHLGITRRRITQLTDDGILKNIETSRGRGVAAKYDWDDSTQAYIKYVSKEEQSEDEAQLNLQKLKAEVQYKQAKAKKANQELKELEGQYLRADDVKDFTTDLIMAMRSDLLAMPGKMGVILAQCKDAQEITGLLEQEAASILEDISKHKYDPAAYAERLKERQGRQQMQNDEEDEEEV